MSDETVVTNVVTFHSWISKRLDEHVKKSLVFLGKAESSLKEGKAQWAKKFSEMAQAEFKVAAEWQDRLNKYTAFENPPVELAKEIPEPVPSNFAEYIKYSGPVLKP